MDELGRRAPLIVGVAAMVLGAVLIAVAVTDSPSRPQVLGETITAPTTTPTSTPASTSTGPTRGIPPPQSQFSGARGAKTATTVEDARSASTSTSSTTTSTATPPTSTSTTSSTTAPPCPTGQPVAVVRTWDGAAAADGVWRVTVTGAVTNRTGATVEVDAVALVFTRADATTYDVPAEQRPQPEPRTIADGAEASWRFDATIPPGAEPTDVAAGVSAWRRPAAPADAACA